MALHASHAKVYKNDFQPVFQWIKIVTFKIGAVLAFYDFLKVIYHFVLF